MRGTASFERRSSACSRRSRRATRPRWPPSCPTPRCARGCRDSCRSPRAMPPTECARPCRSRPRTPNAGRGRSRSVEPASAGVSRPSAPCCNNDNLRGVSLRLGCTDHAGIATQVVVERQLASEGKTKDDLGRDEFLRRVWRWKEESGGTIIRQLKRLGASCDWSRERFTMDAGLSRAVREVFVRLYKGKLIYRDDYIVNWCPRCQTVLSDLEVEREERDAEFVYIKYGPLTLGTVRPETKLGDTGLAVHPKDKRYRKYVGKTLEIPSVDGTIRVKVVADAAVDPQLDRKSTRLNSSHLGISYA